MTNASVACPLCTRPIRTHGGPLPAAPTPSQIIADTIIDVEVWAEGDTIADDGIVLTIGDLARHLAERLAPPLMAIYQAKLDACRAAKPRLDERVRAERAGLTTSHRSHISPTQGRPRKTHCGVCGMPRTEENTYRGQCRNCRKLRQQRVAGVGK